jgi:hypothetical protein
MQTSVFCPLDWLKTSKVHTVIPFTVQISITKVRIKIVGKSISCNEWKINLINQL